MYFLIDCIWRTRCIKLEAPRVHLKPERRELSVLRVQIPVPDPTGAQEILENKESKRNWGEKWRILRSLLRRFSASVAQMDKSDKIENESSGSLWWLIQKIETWFPIVEEEKAAAKFLLPSFLKLVLQVQQFSSLSSFQFDWNINSIRDAKSSDLYSMEHLTLTSPSS